MGTMILRWFLSRTVRQAADMCRQARKLMRAQRDLLSPSAAQAVQEAVLEVRNAIRTGQGNEAIRGCLANLEKAANQHLLSYPNASWRENVEVLLVTGAVVLALRSFFFQPMAIPSGSAQPTLWGIHHENLKGNPAAQIPRGIRRLAECCWAGIHYYHVVARQEGELTKIDPPKRVFPFVKKQTFWVGNESYTIWFPPDQLFEGQINRSGIQPGDVFRKGEDILKLKVVSGDHLFVNRMTYNFRCPRRGETIVFQSHGLPGLIPDTHYIKRLVAVGGDRVRIGDDRHLVINGQRLDAGTPLFENVYGFDPEDPPQTDHYSGHVNNAVGLKYNRQSLAPLFQDEKEEFVVRPRHYLAFGDNTMNSFDGRAWGDFPQEKVVGNSSFVFWPFSSRFGWGYR